MSDNQTTVSWHDNPDHKYGLLALSLFLLGAFMLFTELLLNADQLLSDGMGLIMGLGELFLYGLGFF